MAVNIQFKFIQQFLSRYFEQNSPRKAMQDKTLSLFSVCLRHGRRDKNDNDNNNLDNITTTIF